LVAWEGSSWEGGGVGNWSRSTGCEAERAERRRRSGSEADILLEVGVELECGGKSDVS
jgi:hypothetical protein